MMKAAVVEEDCVGLGFAVGDVDVEPTDGVFVGVFVGVGVWVGVA